MIRRTMAGMMAGVLLASMAAAQPVQWRVEDGGNGHWYQFVVDSGQSSWSRAKLAAEALGGHLATITSAAENDFVLFVARDPSGWAVQGGWPGYCHGPWLGGFQPQGTPEPSGGWRWVTNEPFDYSNWWTPSREPNDGCGGEDYLHLLSQGSTTPSNWWNDGGGPECPILVKSFVIEWSADCNNDGIVDKGQILSGELPDANNNGIPDGGPTITSQPVDQNVVVDTPVTFIVEVANDPACTAPVTFQWQRRNPLVADPTAPGAWIDLADGSGFLNTRGSGLIIVRPTPGLATGYRCKMSGGCGGCEPGTGGFIYTNTVNFTIACPADFNADGGVDFGDIEEFFTRWENGC